MSENHLIPNSFQKPNILTDKLAYYLTPEENTVLDKAVREILGWHNKIEKRKAAISLSVFVEGKFIDGVQVAWGCGVGIAAVRSALKALDKYKILKKEGEATGDGQLFWLQDDSNAIDWSGLEDRKYQKDTKRVKQTETARGVLSNSTPNLLLDNRGGVLLDSNKETQQKPKETKLYTGGSKPQRQHVQKPPLRKQFVIVYREQIGKRILPAHKKAIENLADIPGASIENWRVTLADCVFHWSGNGSCPLDRIIDVYNSGLTYKLFIEQTYGKKNGAHNGHQTQSPTNLTGEKLARYQQLERDRLAEATRIASGN